MNTPECYRCKNEGWTINSLGVYINCPVCHDSRAIRILKDNLFKLTLKLFKLFSDLLNKINWASEQTIHFERLYNVELEGKVERSEKLPFDNYTEVFENGNEVLKNKIAIKIISDYVVGYTVNLDLVRLSIKELVISEKVETLCVSIANAHSAALIGKDKSEDFYKELNDNLKK